MRPWLAFYLGAMGAREKNFYVELGRARRPRRRGARVPGARSSAATATRAAAALTPELIDAMALASTPDALDERLAAFEAVGVDTLRRRAVRLRPAARRARARGGDGA